MIIGGGECDLPTPANPMRENKDVKQDEKCECVNEEHMIKKPLKRNIFNVGSVAFVLLHIHNPQKLIKRNWLLWITYILMEPSLN